MCGQGGIKQAVKVRKQAGSQAIPPQMPSSSTPPSSQMTLAHMTPSSAPPPFCFPVRPPSSLPAVITHLRCVEVQLRESGVLGAHHLPQGRPESKSSRERGQLGRLGHKTGRERHLQKYFGISWTSWTRLAHACMRRYYWSFFHLQARFSLTTDLNFSRPVPMVWPMACRMAHRARCSEVASEVASPALMTPASG